MSIVEINLSALKRSKTETCNLPDLKNKKRVLRTITFHPGVQDSDKSLYPIEVKLSSSVHNQSVSSILLNLNKGNLEILDRYSNDNASNLNLQIKPFVDIGSLKILLTYENHEGYPLYHNETTLANMDDRTKFLENLVKEAKKIEVTKIVLITNLPDIQFIKIRDPYLIDGNAYQLNIERNLEGHFSVETDNISELSRGNLEFITSNGELAYPNIIGVSISGFKKD